jgi:CO/xanthine dehydrogenase FAD-binding subunit
MMRLPPFRYAAPGTAEDAARLLADHGPLAMDVAGGTDLFPNM